MSFLGVASQGHALELRIPMRGYESGKIMLRNSRGGVTNPHAGL